MSMTGFSDSDKLHKKATHRRNDSGELDVFEAARYFSGGGNETATGGGAAFHQTKIMRERMSLDMPMMIRNSTSTLLAPQSRVEKHMKEKKHKQPSSPGGRLASFLNALFSQRASKKKKSKSSSQSVKDEEESPSGRRKRRNSISHFQTIYTTTSTESKSSSSGFRTPPPLPHANTPIKVYKDVGTYSSDHKQVLVPLSRYNGQVRWLDEKPKLFQENKHLSSTDRISEKDRIWGDGYSTEEKDFRRFNGVDDDDGGESDSSSDLFELQNHDLGYYSSGLPVYETTNMDSIKRGGVAIANGTL